MMFVDAHKRKVLFFLIFCIATFFIFSRHLSACQVNQLKSAIQIHNESIQFLKRHNAELRADLDESKEKVRRLQTSFSSILI